LDRQYNTSKSVYDVYKQRSDEAKATLEEWKEKTNSTKDKIAEVMYFIQLKDRLVLFTDTYFGYIASNIYS
jgi:serine protease inhibitor